ncbi:MAG: hypothetical protein C4318_06625 [Acidimicrobiia bacterium]
MWFAPRLPRRYCADLGSASCGAPPTDATCGGSNFTPGPSGPVVVVVAASVVALAYGVATSKRRFRAVLLLGGVGYGIGAFYVIWGAPDLALTQFLVETLMVIVFVLVL